VTPVPPNNRARRYAAAAALSLLCATGALGAQKHDLEKVEAQIVREREKQKALDANSRRLALAAARLRREMIDTARNAQEKEAILTRLEKQLVILVAEAADRETALAAQRRRLAGTLGALARLSRNGPQALMFYPGSPTDMVRSALLLRITVPRLGDRAATLSREIGTLTQVKRDIAGKLLKLRRTGIELDIERAGLRAMLDRKNALRHKNDLANRKQKRAIRRLAARATNIRELLARLKAPRAAPIPEPPAARRAAIPAIPTVRGAAIERGAPAGLRTFPATGPITLPVASRLVGSYGESLDFGNTSRGIRLETRPGAQVVTPFDGKIVFAGPFRNYGQILIIEHRGGYHTLLAGLARIDASIGQWVLAGEPIGAMNPRQGAKPTLYVELRRNGRPINPLPWIAAGKQKVRG
jgi:septal ring factor EnvC (AmiA/AmiB activator)